MINQIFNSDAQEHFEAAINTIINSNELTFWDDRRSTSDIEINGLPYKLTINPSFYGHEKSMYLFVTLRHGDSEKQKRSVGSAFCEFHLSKDGNKQFPSLYMNIKDNSSWCTFELNNQGEVVFDKVTQQELDYSQEVQSIQAQFTKSFKDAMSKIVKKMLDAEGILTTLYQARVAEEEARRKAEEEEFEKFKQNYRLVNEEEVEAMKETLNKTGSISFIGLSQPRLEEVNITFTRTKSGIERTINNESVRTVSEDRAAKMMYKARVKIN